MAAVLAPAPAPVQPTVIQAPQDSLIGDLLSMDLGPPQPQTMPAAAPAFAPSGGGGGGGGMDLLGGGLDELVREVVGRGVYAVRILASFCSRASS